MRTFVIENFNTGVRKTVHAINLSHVVSTRFPGHISAVYNELTGNGRVYFNTESEPRFFIKEVKER